MGKLCMFSEVNGVVLRDGAPVEGALVERTFVWTSSRGETATDSTETGSQGEFHFPPAFKRSLTASILPHNPRIRQTILIRHEGEEYQAWVFVKGNYREDGELQGRPLALVCDLEEEPARLDGVFGICRLRPVT